MRKIKTFFTSIYYKIFPPSVIKVVSRPNVFVPGGYFAFFFEQENKKLDVVVAKTEREARKFYAQLQMQRTPPSSKPIVKNA